MSKTTTVNIASADWITTAEAARILGRNERTVQEMGKDGRLKSKDAGRPDQPRARLYDAQDVIRLAQFTARPLKEADDNRALARQEKGAVSITQRPLSADAAAILETLKIVHSEFRQAEQDRWLKLTDAAKAIGLPKAALRRAIDAGELKAMKSGGWYIKRAHLSAFPGLDERQPAKTKGKARSAHA